MVELLAELGRVAAHALHLDEDASAKVPAELPVVPATRAEFGDFQISACLQLAKPLGKKPRDLAALVQAAVTAHPAIARAEIAGPGFVNLFLSAEWLAARAAAVAADAHLGLRQRQGETVVIDFSAPNIAKPMLIHHMRSTLIGDALQRVFRAVGVRVIADNHLGDWGTQFGKLIVAYRRWLDRDAYARDAIGELVRIYVLFAVEEKKQAAALGLGGKDHRAQGAEGAEGGADEDDDAPQAATPLLAEARAELVKLQKGDPENLAQWREFVEVSLRTFEKSYQRLGVTFDVTLGESFYNDRLPSLVEELLQRGIAEVSRGAVVCPVEGEPVPLLIRKGDGSFLYGTTDLATVEHRVKTWSPQRIVYVVGAPQQLHFRQVFAVARKMGVTCELEHVAFGSMLFPGEAPGTWVMGRTRGGTTLLLDDFLDEVIAAAAKKTRELNPELTDAQVAEVARVAGIGAVKYSDLSRDRNGDIRFDIEKAVDPQGNSAVYLLYAYARMRSIARKAAARGAVTGDDGPLAVNHAAERALLLRALSYPLVIEQVVRTARPHSLAEFLYDLATAVSKFYEECPVLDAPPADRAARLRLLGLVARTLQHGLGLLGIETVEEM